MLLDKNEIKQQTRVLWKRCFGDTDDFLDIYFERKYTDESNLTIRRDAQVVAAAQVLPYRLLFGGQPLPAGYLSGLCVHPQQRGNGFAARLVRAAHRKLHRQGAALSLLIPGDESLRRFYECPRHGAYRTATYRTERELLPGGATDATIDIAQPCRWSGRLYAAFRRLAVQPFMLQPAENDFFAALEDCRRGKGAVLVARRGGRVSGLCLAVNEADGRIFVRSLWAADPAVRNAFLRHISPDGRRPVYARVPAAKVVENPTKLVGNPTKLVGEPAKLVEKTMPYAMARVVNVARFLSVVAAAKPDLSLHVCVSGDLDVPANNGCYRVSRGHVSLTDDRPGLVVSPGGLAELLLAAQPVRMEMLLDE